MFTQVGLRYREDPKKRALETYLSREGGEMIDGTETDDTDWQKKTTPNEIVRQICPFKVAPPQVGGCRVSAEYHRFQIVAFGQSRISERRLITGTGLFFSPMFVRGTVGGDR